MNDLEKQVLRMIGEDPDAPDVFTDDPDLLWSRGLRRKGPEYARLSTMPCDPSMN